MSCLSEFFTPLLRSNLKRIIAKIFIEILEEYEKAADNENEEDPKSKIYSKYVERPKRSKR